MRKNYVLKDCDQLEEDKILKMFDMENIFLGNETFCTKWKTRKMSLIFKDALTVCSPCSPAVYITLSLQYIFTVSLLGNVL